jgi:hypothetical protein
MLMTWLRWRRRSQDRRRDHRVPQDVVPFCKALVGRQDDAPAPVAGGDQRKECRRGYAIVAPDSKLVDDQDLGPEVHAHPPVEPVLVLRAAEVFKKLMGPDEVDAMAGIDCLEGEAYAQMRLAHSRRAEQDDVGGIPHKREGREFLDLPLVDRRLEVKIKLLQGPREGQMGKAHTGAQVAFSTRRDLEAQ